MGKPGPSSVPGKKAGPNGSFPIGDAKHARLAIGGATRSYNAGNISKSTENHIKAQARNFLSDKGPAKSDPPKGRGSSERSAAGPREERADSQGDGMRPMKPAPISPRHNGRGHMGSWADREHPVGRR